MFTDDVEEKKISGTSYHTFQPNTLVYAADVNSKIGKKINKAKIGVVWHTTYKGSDLQDMSASFGVDISGLRKPSSVWMDDATYKDVSGSAKFTRSETEQVTKILSSVGTIFRKIKSSELRKFLSMQEKSFSKSKAGGSFKTYLNQFIKSGENFSVQNVKNLNYSCLLYTSDAADE